MHRVQVHKAGAARQRLKIPRIAKRNALFVISNAVIGAVIAIGIGQFSLWQYSKNHLKEYTTGLLSYSVGIAEVGIEAFNKLDEDSAPLCSKGDLAHMRYLLFHAPALYDIGRVKGNRVICTGMQGRFKDPFLLPPVQRKQGNGVLLWANTPIRAKSC